VARGATLVFVATLALLSLYAFRKKLLPGESCWGFLKEGERDLAEMVRLLSEDRPNPNPAPTSPEPNPNPTPTQVRLLSEDQGELSHHQEGYGSAAETHTNAAAVAAVDEISLAYYSQRVGGEEESAAGEEGFL